MVRIESQKPPRSKPMPPRTLPATESLPVLLLRRGPVSMRSLMALHEDRRFELFPTDELTPAWISFAKRIAGVIVATEGDPLSAFGYAVTAEIPNIVVLMGKQHRAECEIVMSAGALACVTMPMTPPELDRIASVLGAHTATSRVDPTLRLLLDPIGRTVRFHERAVHLSQREFALLHCLSESRGRPVSAEELLTSVWGESQGAEKSRIILDVYVCQVRKKLAELGLGGSLSTIRGFGYVLGGLSS
jgi:hypothetical protein